MHDFLKNKLWLLKLPVVVIFTLAFLVNEGINSGAIEKPWVHALFHKPTQWVVGRFTDLKFFLRGEQNPVHPKIVIVDIDNYSIEKVNVYANQRWPWHRDVTAELVRKVFEYGAKAAALDIVFSEPDTRISPELREALVHAGVRADLESFETDNALVRVVGENIERTVLGWMSPSKCRPRLDGAEECAVTDPEALALIPPSFRKFKLDNFVPEPGFDPKNTAIQSAPVVVSNIPKIEDSALWAGSFDVQPDVDGIVRRISLVTMVGGEPHPTLALRMASLASANPGISIAVSKDGRIQNLELDESKIKIPVSKNGTLEMNFRGKKHTFPYVSAFQLLAESFEKDEKGMEGLKRELAGFDRADPRELLKDALVFIGISATGAYDMRAFPYDPDVPGVEGHATILDNILAQDWLIPSFSSLGGWGTWIVFLLMTVLALAASYYAQVLDALPAMLLFAGSFVLCVFFDVFVLFKNFHMNWNTSFLYLEMATVFALSIAAKYFREEQNKKFLKGTFAKYVSPALVDSIVENPEMVNLGGERRELTILFSDIRSFTTFSEQMDAKALSSFLNDYLGIMTNIVFKYKGTLDKYIGDAVMAFWGAPIEDPDHAYNAVLAAQEMMKALHENRPRWMEAYFKGIKDVKIDIGIGIHTGVVSVGNMGCEGNVEYTVIGDNVNLASRLEGLTKSYHAHILTSRATFEDVVKLRHDLPAHRTLDQVKVKGKKQAVELIEIFDKPASSAAIEEFNRARSLYASQSWQLARESFLRAHELMKNSGVDNDEICLEYVERCQEFEKNPPGADWDGSWTMTSK